MQMKPEECIVKDDGVIQIEDSSASGPGRPEPATTAPPMQAAIVVAPPQDHNMQLNNVQGIF